VRGRLRIDVDPFFLLTSGELVDLSRTGTANASRYSPFTLHANILPRKFARFV
jgi:hypothetical protein